MLFLGILAGSVVFAIFLWKLGQHERRTPSDIGTLVVGLLICLHGISQAYEEWTGLGAAIGHIRTASLADLSGYLADAELARRRLVMNVIWATMVVGLFVAYVAKLIKAFKSRTAEKAAKTQETHA